MYKVPNNCISIHNPYASLSEVVQGHSSGPINNTVMNPLDDHIRNCNFSLANDSACTKRKIFSWAFWIISVSMLSFSWFKDETYPILFNQIPFSTMISAIILFIFIQLEVIFRSLDNTELFGMLVTLILTTFLTSGSSSDTSSSWLFPNQHCFLFHRKEGPSNHLLIWSFFLESKPCKTSSAGLLLLST